MPTSTPHPPQQVFLHVAASIAKRLLSVATVFCRLRVSTAHAVRAV